MFELSWMTQNSSYIGEKWDHDKREREPVSVLEAGKDEVSRYVDRESPQVWENIMREIYEEKPGERRIPGFMLAFYIILDADQLCFGG